MGEPGNKNNGPAGYFCKKPLRECSRTLIRVAQGRMPADLVIRDCKLVDVCTREILEHTDIAIAEGRIAYIGINPHTAEHCIGPNTRIIDADGAYVAPGFLDGHMHVESSMVTPVEYARVAVPHGTTGVYHDPHEAGNVVGLAGIKEFARSTESVPLKFMLTMPSCIPAVDGFEDSGAEISPDDISEAIHDVLKAFVFERHHETGTHAAGFVRGLGIHGALAQTVARCAQPAGCRR
jgi:adenine deaminase